MAAGTHDHIWNPLTTRDGRRVSLWKAMRARAYLIFSDEILVQRARAGDHGAFDALVARYRSRLYTLALSSLGNEGEAGDALCEMVLSAFKDIQSLGVNCTAGTWLYMHGFRVVFKRMNVLPGTYKVERRPAAGVASRDDD